MIVLIMTKRAVLLFFCWLAFSAFVPALSLKCRTGNQQSDDQFQKIIQVCRRRYLGYDRDNAHNSRRTDSQESDSDSVEDVFDRKFLTTGGSNNNNNNNNNRYNNNNNRNADNARYDHSSSSRTRTSSRGTMTNRNWNANHSFSTSYNNNNNNYNDSRSSYDYNNGNNNNRPINNYNGRHNTRNGNNMDSSRGHSTDSNNYANGNNNYNDRNNNGNNDEDDREQACVVQCFFNELNLVDQRGYPERSSVINVMTQNIQDPELRDFVEESVIECYHHLLNNNGRQEKCQFSQNLLSCLAEKGSERCEDWEDKK